MKSINEKIEQLTEKFQEVKDWEDRYKMIIKMGKEMEPLTDDQKKDDLKVQGCQSQVWLHADYRDGRIYFHADSDALIAKGIVAMLISVYSGSTPDEILTTKPDFLTELGVKEHLSMGRTNGLMSMIKQISIYAMAFKAKESM